MNFKQEPQKDIEILDRILLVQSVMSEKFIKTAEFEVITTLKEIAENIKTLVSNRIKNEGFFALFTYGLSGILPIKWGIISALIENFTGYSIGQLVSNAINEAKKIIEQKGDFTEDDAIRISEKITPKEASFSDLYELEKRGKLFSTLRKNAGPQKRNLFEQFKSIFDIVPTRAGKKRIGGGLIGWLIKNILLGIALIEGPDLVKAIVTKEKIQEKPGEYTATGQGERGQSVIIPVSNIPQQQSTNLKPSGKGEEFHINAGNTSWIVPLSNRDIKQTLARWAIAVYPSLKSVYDKLSTLPSFNRMALILAKEYTKQEQLADYVTIPINTDLHSIKDIVDRFSGDAEKLLQQA